MPFRQVLPAQQGCPGPPQVPQLPAPGPEVLHASVALVQVLPVQQGWSFAPHATHDEVAVGPIPEVSQIAPPLQVLVLP